VKSGPPWRYIDFLREGRSHKRSGRMGGILVLLIGAVFMFGRAYEIVQLKRYADEEAKNKK
jgi:hypothetical protein